MINSFLNQLAVAFFSVDRPQIQKLKIESALARRDLVFVSVITFRLWVPIFKIMFSGPFVNIVNLS